jgi:hypothetical protein
VSTLAVFLISKKRKDVFPPDISVLAVHRIADPLRTSVSLSISFSEKPILDLKKEYPIRCFTTVIVHHEALANPTMQIHVSYRIR